MMIPYVFGDFSYFLLTLAILAVFVLSLLAQSRVQKVFLQYNRQPAQCGMTAETVAKSLLRQNGCVLTVQRVQGSLTDHYNPKTNTVGLSEAVHDSASVGALAIAAHEIGHVMQYEEGHFGIRLRNAILPVANFGSNAGPYLILGGLLLSAFAGGNVGYYIAMIGVYLYAAMFLFQLVTLPVEFDASRRALILLTEGGYLREEELGGAKKVLRAAAWTYVLAALASLLSVLRLFVLVKGNRRRS